MVSIGPLRRVWIDGQACTGFADDHGRVVDVLVGWFDEHDDASLWLHWAMLAGLDDGADAVTGDDAASTA
jgi:hypothetical protein